jgi:putative nucleotidyltransferase with HDIG domain
MLTTTLSKQLAPLDSSQIENRLRQCPRLPSLNSINSALRELLTADQRYTSQIAEVIRRDPSLTARLLRLVNSVYYGLSAPINSIEEAVFYLGVRQIRQLAMVTPVIEDFQKLAGSASFKWREFWQHCIAVAIVTREVLGNVQTPPDEVDYVAGLTHDVGKIVMASAFPEHFSEIHRRLPEVNTSLLDLEAEILGIDHAMLGALYLRSHNLPEVLVETARHHHAPEKAGHNAQIVAAVQIADLMVRNAQIGNSLNRGMISSETCANASGWSILNPGQNQAERAIAQATLNRSVGRLPSLLEGLV